MRVNFFLLWAFLGFPFLLLASESQPCEVAPPPGLDFKTRQATRRLIELEPFGGEYLGNYLHNSYVVGGRLGFRVSEAITLAAEFNYTGVRYDGGSEFGKSSPSSREWIGAFTFNYAFPILQRTGKAIQEADLTTTVGLGNLHIDGKERLVGVVGGGLKLFTALPWLALRFDAMTYLYSLPRANDSKFADDWTFTVGPSFLFVPRR